jgi:L-lactate dehydrogenase complex protein LldG
MPLKVTMDARQSILSALKRQVIPQTELPEVVSGPWIEFEDCVSKFCEMVEFSGGRSHRVGSRNEVLGQLENYPEFSNARLIFSAIEEVPGNVKMDDFKHPHELDPLDFVIYPGDFAVAENGAIWLTDRNVKHRVCFFITQYLVLVVSADRIVHNMHQAYDRLKPPLDSFGLFCAGPSKTADIEQSLVIGAHGCRGLEVFIVSENGGSH